MKVRFYSSLSPAGPLRSVTARRLSSLMMKWGKEVLSDPLWMFRFMFTGIFIFSVNGGESVKSEYKSPKLCLFLLWQSLNSISPHAIKTFVNSVSAETERVPHLLGRCDCRPIDIRYFYHANVCSSNFRLDHWTWKGLMWGFPKQRGKVFTQLWFARQGYQFCLTVNHQHTRRNMGVCIVCDIISLASAGIPCWSLVARANLELFKGWYWLTLGNPWMCRRKIPLYNIYRQ